MKIRLYDVFDRAFTVAVYSDVECIIFDTIVFTDGDEAKFDPQYESYEIIQKER